MKEIKTVSANDLQYEVVRIDDPQIIDEYYGLTPKGGCVNMESWWILKDIKQALPSKKEDYRVIELQAFKDSDVDFSPLLRQTAGMLDGLDAIDEDKNTVFVQVVHARVIAQLGIPFDIVAPAQYIADGEKDILIEESPFEDSPMQLSYSDHEKARLASDLPIRISNGSEPNINRFGSTPKPIFVRERIDIRSSSKIACLI